MKETLTSKLRESYNRTALRGAKPLITNWEGREKERDEAIAHLLAFKSALRFALIMVDPTKRASYMKKYGGNIEAIYDHLWEKGGRL